MASIAMMIGGAFLNAAAFTDGNYLPKYRKGFVRRENAA